MSRTKQLLTLLVAMFISLGVLTHASWVEGRERTHVVMVRTPMTRTELMVALREGHLRVFGKLPSRNRLAMAWGQVAFENGHGKLVYNHNLGNVGSSAPDQPTYYNRGDGHWYRSHETDVDGAVAYWEVIKRCSAALANFDWGNPNEAAKHLKRCNYFEADLDTYTHGFSPLFYLAYNKVYQEEENERQQKELLAAIKRVVNDGCANGGCAATSATDVTIDDIIAGFNAGSD
jgi:hypothetical protein